MGRTCHRFVCILFICTVLVACSTTEPTWRGRVSRLVEELGQQEAPRLFPQEYRNLLETFEHGEAIYHVQVDHKIADAYYRLALQKAEILQMGMRNLKQRQAEAERRRIVEEAARLREEQLMREAAEAELRLRAQELKIAEAAAKVVVTTRKPHARDVALPQPASYTVRRGETLPQIAGRFEIYNDSLLWPLIYRANRDQIRDPKRLWPGQVLIIPRHLNRDDVVEARRYSGKNNSP